MIRRMVFAAAVAAAFSSGPASAASQIKLGYHVGLTGVFGIVGAEQQRGLQLALEELDNKLGGVPVSLYTVDDKGVPTEAVQVASKLIDQNKIDIVTGLMNSATLIATMNQYLNAGVFAVSGLAGPLQYAG